MEGEIIRKWKTCLYNSRTKKWMNGELELRFSALHFSQEDKDDDAFSIDFKFGSLRCVDKSLSSFIYPAIIVVTKDGAKFWLSSFTQRDETLLYLQYFLEQYILNNDSEPLPVLDDNGSSTFGRQLLRTVVESHSTLANAGTQLEEQGHQIRKTSTRMMEVASDLNVASKVLKGLKAWLPRWRIPNYHQDSSEMFSVLNKKDVANVPSFEVLFYNRQESMLCLSNVILETSGISFMDMYQKILHHFKWSDVSRLQVMTFWEFSVTCYMIGKPDVKCNIVSSYLLPILQQMENFAPQKIEYVSSALECACNRIRKNRRHYGSQRDQYAEQATSSSTSKGFELNQDCQHEDLTEHDASLLSKELRGLKSLALNIQKEEDKQLKEIDELTHAVTKGTDTLSNLNKTINKLC